MKEDVLWIPENQAGAINWAIMYIIGSEDEQPKISEISVCSVKSKSNIPRGWLPMCVQPVVGQRE